jgi:hypothetical protein
MRNKLADEFMSMGLTCHQPGVQGETKNHGHLIQVAMIDYIFLRQKDLNHSLYDQQKADNHSPCSNPA